MLLCEIFLKSLLKGRKSSVSAVVTSCRRVLEISMDHRGMDKVQSQPNQMACKRRLISVLIYARTVKELFSYDASFHMYADLLQFIIFCYYFDLLIKLKMVFTIIITLIIIIYKGCDLLKTDPYSSFEWAWFIKNARS